MKHNYKDQKEQSIGLEIVVTHDFGQHEKSDQACQKGNCGDAEVTKSTGDGVGAHAGDDEGGQGSKESPQPLWIVKMTMSL